MLFVGDFCGGERNEPLDLTGAWQVSFKDVVGQGVVNPVAVASGQPGPFLS